MEVQKAVFNGKEIVTGNKYRIKADCFSWKEGCPRWADGHLVEAVKINRLSVKVKYLDEIDNGGNTLFGYIPPKFLFATDR